MGKPRNTRKYPTYPRYPKVKKVPGNTWSYFLTLLPNPNPTRYPVFCPIPDPTRPDIEKPYPLGTANQCIVKLICKIPQKNHNILYMWIIVSVKKVLQDIFQVCIFVSVKGCISVSDKLVSRGRWSVGGATFEVTITPAYAETRYWYVWYISLIFYDAILIGHWLVNGSTFEVKITHSAPEDRRGKNKCVQCTPT